MHKSAYLDPDKVQPLAALGGGRLNPDLINLLQYGRQEEHKLVTAIIGGITLSSHNVEPLPVTLEEKVKAVTAENWTKQKLHEEVLAMMDETGAAQPLFLAQFDQEIKNKSKACYVSFYHALEEYFAAGAPGDPE